MSKKIFVGNLSFNTTESDLDSLFGQVGPVESVCDYHGSDDRPFEGIRFCRDEQ